MKRLSLLALVLAPFAASAQTKHYSYFSLGPIGSIGSSWIDEWVGDREPKLSGSYGLDLSYSRAEHIGFGADLTLSHEGFAADYPLNGVTSELVVNTLYARFTPKVILFFNQWGDAVRPKVWAGPSFGLKLRETNDLDPDRPGYEDNDQQLGSEVFKNGDLGIQAGAGFNVRLATAVWLQAGAAYYYGLTDVVENRFQLRDAAQHNLRAVLGVSFGLGISRGKAHRRDAR